MLKQCFGLIPASSDNGVKGDDVDDVNPDERQKTGVSAFLLRSFRAIVKPRTVKRVKPARPARESLLPQLPKEAKAARLIQKRWECIQQMQRLRAELRFFMNIRAWAARRASHDAA